MGHDLHFLRRLERASSRETELALRLYRDGEAVRHVLEHARLPDGAEVVALSLDPADQGPYALVTRPEGRFVTCLARGMGFDEPRIEHARLLALLERLEERRGRRALAEELAGGEEIGGLITRLLTRGSELSREEFVALTALTPLIRETLLWQIIRTVRPLITRRAEHGKPRYVRPDQRQVARGYWNDVWFVGNALPLVCYHGPEGLEHTFSILREQRSGEVFPARILFSMEERVIAFRALWSVARLGKTVLPSFKQVYRAPRTAMEWLTVFGGLLALGARHSSLRAEIRKTLGDPPTFPGEFRDLLEELPADFRSTCVEAAFEPDPGEAVRARRSQERVWRRLHPDGAPLPEGAALDAAVPPELALTLAINLPGTLACTGSDLVELLMPIASVARARGEDLFLPQTFVNDHDGYSDERYLELLERHTSWIDKPTVRREAPKVGRNELCPCGSGRKFKRCCGGG